MSTVRPLSCEGYPVARPLAGKSAPVLGIAGRYSIASGRARTFRARARRGRASLHGAQEKSALRQLADIGDVGVAAAFLATPYGRHMTGSTFVVDAGLSAMG